MSGPLAEGDQVIVGTHAIPQYVSWIAILVTGLLSYGLFREARR